MKIKTFILFFLTSFIVSYAQDVKTKADTYFYSYAYDKAISQYKKEMNQGKTMTNQQLLNLADAYFHTKDYIRASKIYLDVNKKDSIMTTHQFNKMLQSLSKTSEKDRVKAFLHSKSPLLSNELIENAAFNYEVLDSDVPNKENIKIFNSNANSPQSDFSPAFYGENRLIFSSGRPHKSKEKYGPSGESYLELYITRFTPDGNVFSNPNVLSGIYDSKYHKSTPFYAEKLDKLFYSLSNEDKGKLLFDDNGKNSLAIGIAKNSSGPDKSFDFLLRDLSTSFYYPFYDAEAERLYFSANFEDSYGGTDIYYVHTNYGRIQSAPINLGPRINSPANEIAPFILNNSLYFSSDIFYGLGGMDVYKSNIQDDDVYSIPINIGEGINSKSDDFGLIIKTKGEGFIGYFSSNRRGGRGNDDIYGFKMEQEPGLKTFSIKGKVMDLVSANGLEKVQVKLFDKEGDVIKEVYTNERGDYRFEVPWQDEFRIEATKERHSIFSVNLSGDALQEVQENAFDMNIAALDGFIEEKEGQKVIKLKKFYFDKGKSTLNASITIELDKVVKAVARFPELRLNIETHTDSRGSTNGNKYISQKRSDAIKNYLLKNGVASSNIAGSIGYGEQKIINNCTNGAYCLDFLHNQNARTYIAVVNYDELR